MKLCPVCHRCYEDADTACLNDQTALVASRPGTRLIADKYRLDLLLGRGGMGAVYAGNHVDLDRPVAVKLLLPDFTADPDALERFRREARAAARLNHPNVADTYDYGVLPDGGAYIVMELVEGQTLREYMDASGQLPTGEAAEIGRQVADGIAAAHQRDIVHRDLKPSNIILTRDHKGHLQAKVVDFGVAQLKEYSTTGGGLTASGSLIGTPRYMSPEQCSGHKTDARSDIYSMGVILFEMLAGRAPFEAPTATAIAIKHIQQPPPSVREFRLDAPAELDRFLRQVMDKDPEKRPQSASEFARQLSELSEDFGTSETSRAAVSEQTFAPTTPAPGSETKAFTPLDKATGRTGQPTAEHSYEANENSIRSYAEPAEVATEVVTKIAETAAPGVQATEAASVDTIEAKAPEPEDNLPAQQAASVTHSATEDHRLSTQRPVLIFGGAAFALGFIAVAIWLTVGRTSPGDVNNSSAPSESVRSNTTPKQAEPQLPAGASIQANNNAAPQKSPGDARSELKAALMEWVEATNARDLDRQMSHYAPELDVFYRKRNVTRAAVRAEKARLFSLAESVNVQTGEPEIKLDQDGKGATMRFRKSWDFKGAAPQTGEVVQELRWRKTDSGWKIVSERDVEVIRIG